MCKFFALMAFNRWGSSCQAGWSINRYFHSDRGVAGSDDPPGRRQARIRYRFCLATTVAIGLVASNFLQQRGNDFYGLGFMLCRIGSGKEAFVPRNYLCFCGRPSAKTFMARLKGAASSVSYPELGPGPLSDKMSSAPFVICAVSRVIVFLSSLFQCF